MTAIADALERARERWPSVIVSEAALADHVASCGLDAAAEIRADLVLACACLAGDSAAIAAFEAELLAPVAARIARMGTGSAAADEAISRLRATLFVAEPGAKPRLA